MPLTTYNNVPVPSFMYGTAWKKEATAQLVQLAVAAGFTAIDTANQLIHYQEALVGEALLALARKGMTRDRLFLQTKFTPTNGQDHRTPYDASAALTTQVAQSFDSSLVHLHTDYLDSYVLHGPYQRQGLGAADWEVWADRDQQCHSRATHSALCQGSCETHDGAKSLLCRTWVGQRGAGDLPDPWDYLSRLFALDCQPGSF